MAGTTGFEPATSDVTGRRSNQLNYVPEVYNNVGNCILTYCAVQAAGYSSKSIACLRKTTGEAHSSHSPIRGKYSPSRTGRSSRCPINRA